MLPWLSTRGVGGRGLEGGAGAERSGRGAGVGGGGGGCVTHGRQTTLIHYIDMWNHRH